MSNRTRRRLVMTLLILSLLLSDLGSFAPAGPVPEAEASFLGLNAINALGNLISATNRRNRIYNDARVTQQDMNAYYDSLISTAREQLVDRELMGAEDQGQAWVYIKLTNALRAENAAVTQQIEAQKNQARQQFNHALGQEILNILIKSPGGQKIIKNVRDTIGGLREAALAVQAALNANRPEAVIQQLVDDYTEKMNLLPGIQQEVRNLGSSVGSKLDQALGGVLSQAEHVMTDVAGELGQTLTQLDQFDAFVAGYQEQVRTPVNLIEEGDILHHIHGVDQVNAGFDVAVQAYTNAAIIAGAIKGDDSSKDNMRDSIRQQLLEQRTQELSQVGESMSLVKCSGVGQVQYEQAAAQLGITPVKPLDPKKAAYIVCIDKETGLPVHAALIGPEAAEGEEPEEEPTEEVNEIRIPVGDYVGTTSIPNSLTEIWPSHVVANTLELHVEEDGTITGRATFETEGHPDPSPSDKYPNCALYTKVLGIGTIEGRMTDMNGTFTITFSRSQEATYTECSVTGPYYTDSNAEYKFVVSVSGDLMTGHVGTGQITMEATRQEN